MTGSCPEKNNLYLNKGPRKSRFLLNIPDRRTDIYNYNIASLLKSHDMLTNLKLVSKKMESKVSHIRSKTILYNIIEMMYLITHITENLVYEAS